MSKIVYEKVRLMKSRNLLPWQKFKNKLGECGQSIVEFILLLTVVAGISYAFTTFMSRNLDRYWEYSVNLILNDSPNGAKKVSF